MRGEIELSLRVMKCAARLFIHPPLLASESEPEAVTLKSGVALGMLATLAGEKLGVINRHSDAEEASFQYCVGTLANECLKPKLLRNTPYGKWVEFGKVPGSGKIKALYSANPAAVDGTLRRGAGCLEATLNFGAHNKGKKILVQAKSPSIACFALQGGEGEVLEEMCLELRA